ncbi:MAG: formyltransferase family protein, partial [Legionella sp.]
MQNQSLFSCYLIGDDHLLVSCAELLLNQGHSVLGIICPLDAAKKLAQANHISHFESLSEAHDTLLATSYDYLFSVINSTILPLSIIERACQQSINFHNAPLPFYAGVHALSWAILNQELEHGVTWHVMTEQIDAGDILKQTIFPIDAHETALSLSLKCYAEALSLFSELIYDLAHYKINRIPQDTSKTTYYSFKQKPKGNGWINWSEPAKTIECMTRALNLGHYHHNRLACPKLMIGDHAYIVTKMHVLEEPSIKEPGTITSILSNAWHINTGTQLLSIEQLVSIDGTPHTLNSLIERHNLKVDSILPTPNTEQLEQYHALSEQSAAAELYWVKQLIGFKPSSLPFQPQNTAPYSGDELVALTHLSIFEENDLWTEQLPQQYDPMDIVIATLFIYLYRFGNKEKTSLWFHDSPAQNIPSPIKI